MPTKPTIYYFPLRGRAEYLKLALAAVDAEFDVEPVDYATMKTDAVAFPFGQCPRYADDSVDNLCQSNAILRHLGRKYNLYGASIGDAAHIDAVIEGVESIRTKYVDLIYTAQLADEAKATYCNKHCNPATKTERNGGAHFSYLEAILGAGPYVVGDALSIADIAVFDIVDLHVRIFDAEMRANFPGLMAHHARVAAVPGIAKYLASPLRLPKINGNDLG